ncbi:MAG: FAD-dependent oxidoreductase [Candidatus Latescibacterota bacterium]
MSFPNLFSPIKLGSVEIKNRTVMAPMNNGLLSTDETWPYTTIRYYEERARGGIGLIITGATRIYDKLCGKPKVGLYDARFIPSHKKLVDAIHALDTKIFCQFTLNGGKIGREGPSAVYSNNYALKPRELTTDEVDLLVESFIKAAGYAREAGYDGVEIHGGHSYLVGQFMSPNTNVRTDKYGGSFEKRMRFPSDIVRGIHERYPGFAVGIKFSAYEELPGGIDIPTGLKIAQHLAGLDVVYLHVSSTSTENLVSSEYSSVPALYVERNTLMPLAEGVKKICPDQVVMGTGSITVPEEAEDHIAKGKCDMVALGRTIVADPFWPVKAKEGKQRRITPCIRCNNCYQQLWVNEPLICSVNPYVSHEGETQISRTEHPKKVMIVGGGPAGIRCAITASRRGHDVTIYEKRPYLGGALYPGSRPHFKQDVARLIAWFEEELKNSTVKVKLNTEVTQKLVEEAAPDALVIAVGGENIAPDVPGMDKPHVAFATDVLRDISKYKGKKAVVIGGGDVGCETACYLADKGFDVTLVEMTSKLMEQNNQHVRLEMYAMLKRKPKVRVMTETALTAIIDEGAEVVLPNGKRWGLEAELVAIAVGVKAPGADGAVNVGPLIGVKAKAGIVAELSMKAPEIHVIGDCDAVGKIMDAVREGERVARWL